MNDLPLPSAVVGDATPTGVACHLPVDAQPERRRRLQELVVTHRPDVQSSDRTVTWTFDDPAVLDPLMELVDLERACCPSLSFHVDAPAGGAVVLTVSGPPGSRDFIAAWLPVGEPSAPRGPAWWIAGAATTSLGGAFALLCCVVPAGAALAAAVSVPLAVFDGIGALLLAAGAVLGVGGLWRWRQARLSCGPGCP